jgi:hypothetical protein
MFQGNPNVGNGNFPGNQFSFFAFNATQVQTDLVGRTITKVELELVNIHSWNSGGMTVVVGYSNRTNSGDFPSSIGSFTGSDIQNLQQTHINQGQDLVFDATFLKPDLANNTCKSILLGPAPNLSLSYYGYFDGFGQGNLNLRVTSVANTGGNQSAGNGARGQVKITYASSTTLLFALAPVAGFDANGNSYAAGFTGVGGSVTAFAPGSNPTAVETWHPITGGVGYAARWADLGGAYTVSGYRLHPDNTVEVRIAAIYTVASSTAFLHGGVIFTLPVVYRPTAGAVTAATMCFGPNATYIANQTQSIRIASDTGNVQLFGLNTSTVNGQTFSVLAHARFSVV